LLDGYQNHELTVEKEALALALQQSQTEYLALKNMFYDASGVCVCGNV